MTFAMNMLDQATLAKAQQPGSAGGGKSVATAAKEFESMFLGEMLKPMFEDNNADSMFGGGETEKMFRSLLVDEYGKLVSRSGKVGIADSVMRAMLAAQEEQKQ